MRIVPYAPHHLHRLALQPHQQHLGPLLRENGWAEEVVESGPCWTAFADGEPIACAGLHECWEGRAVAWALLSEAAGRHMHALTRLVRRALEMHPASRIEAHAQLDFVPALRWARLLGFTPEAVLRNFHRGLDFQSYVYLKPGLREDSIVHESIDRISSGIGDDNADQDAENAHRAVESHGVENIGDDHRHRNQAHHDDAGRREKACQKSAGDGKEENDAQHPCDSRNDSTHTCPPLLEPKDCADNIGMWSYRLVDDA
jgi:RimJ/RimL family protein N-acetyltransferase